MQQPSENVSRLLHLLSADPDRAEVRYLLGAELAAAGRYQDAVSQIEHAVRLDPKLHTGVLQLGLLHLTSGRPNEALQAWQPLEQLDEGHALKLFKRGLECLIHDDFVRCAAWLESGIRANQANPALNKDMTLVLDRIRPLLPSAPPAAAGAAADAAVRTDFSLYEPKKS
jgi:tetratricopeptide (TPR) repeat protein